MLKRKPMTKRKTRGQRRAFRVSVRRALAAEREDERDEMRQFVNEELAFSVWQERDRRAVAWEYDG